MFEGIAAAAAEVAATPGVRAVVLHGEGPSFCSGLDIASLLADGPDGFEFLHDREGPRKRTSPSASPPTGSTCRCPVIAAVHGNCFGGGLQIALGADIRIAAPDAKLSIMEARWGLVPDMGITQTLTRLRGRSTSPRSSPSPPGASAARRPPRSGSSPACAADPLAAAQELAAEIAGRSPDAVRAAKRLYEATWPRARRRAPSSSRPNCRSGSWARPNQLEAVRSGMAKEPADFTDPG